MTTMVAELYDALLAAGAPDEKARKAAEVMAGYEAFEQRFERIENDIGELKRDVTELKVAVSGLDRRASKLDGDVAGLKHDMADVKRDVFPLKWMMGFVPAFQVAIFIKLFLH